MTEIKVIVDDEGHDVDVVFDENIEVEGGGKITKEIVLVDIEAMISEQNVKLFMDLSKRFASGEIVIVGSLFGQTAVVNAVDIRGEKKANWSAVAGEWISPIIEGGGFEPYVTVFGIECDGEKIVIGSGSIENPDLSDYVKNTDIAKKYKAGLMWSDSSLGIFVDPNTGGASIVGATTADIDGGTNTFHPLTPFNMKYAIKKSITTNTETWTDDEKEAACETIGAVPTQQNTDNTYRQVYILKQDGTNGIIRLANAIPYQAIPIGDNNGRIFTGDPILDYNATNKTYVDNLPDHLTLTDEQKAKWRGLIGATKLYKHSIPIPIENGLSDLSPNAELVYYSTSNEPNYTSAVPVHPRLVRAMEGINPRIVDLNVGVNVPILGNGAEGRIFRLNTRDGTILQETLTSLGDDTVTEF